MLTQNITYDMCRLYVDDLSAELGPLHATLVGYIRSRNVKGLSTCTSLLEGTLYSLNNVRILRQVEAFFKKNKSFVSEADCESAAVKAFHKAEMRCRFTNRRLSFYYAKRDLLDPDLSSWMDRMVSYISDTLGPYRSFIDVLPSMLQVTSGATASRSRAESLPFLKLRRRIDCSPGSSAYLRAICQYFDYTPLGLTETPINRVEFVPKNWKTHRSIACEPTGNIPLQLAFDAYAKRCLRRRGIDLSDQSKNQLMAKEGSVSGKYATIDLSAASDTLSFDLVNWLLPDDWFKYLNSIRSKFYRGSSIGFGRYEKFSSMGNGSTFCLETLVFAAACYAVGSKDFSVYGDDIIVETEKFDDLRRLLRFVGFSLNLDKSFHEGPFRESCGADWFNGINITPFYIREADKRLTTWAHLVNGLVGIGKLEGKLWEFCRFLVRKKRIPLVPHNADSTSGIWIDAHRAYSLHLIRHQHGISEFKALVTKTKSRSLFDSRTLFLWFLRKNFRYGAPDVVISSRIPTLSHKYVRKWVGYWVPAGTPDYLYWWSAYLSCSL